MTAITVKNNNLILDIPKDMLSEALIQKVIRLIEYKNLTKNNDIAEQEAFAMAEEAKTNWWKNNKDWFLKDVTL